MIITGVGKSGIIARKMAATFSSIGLIAIYLNPVDALHGDLGLVDKMMFAFYFLIVVRQQKL